MQSATLDSKNEVIHGLLDMPRWEAVALLEAGYFLLQLGKKREARDLFVGVSALFPKSEVPCVALGNLYLSEGKPDLAVKEHLRALQRAPNSATAQAHLGEALLFAKRKEEGVIALEKAIQMDPKGLAAKLAHELLRANDLHVFDGK